MPNFASSGLPNPQSYDLGVPGTVIDNVTGLMWQRTVRPGNFTWERALDACDRLELAGYHDWRLPSRIELVSILNMAETEPSIDGTAFPSTPADWFWSSSVAAESPAAAWYVYFYFGYPKVEEQSSPFRIRCVRTANPPPDAGDADGHYEVRTASVHDRDTGLTWQRTVAPRSFAFHAAVGYCGQLSLDGHKDWRVPSMPELETLIDEGASAPAIDGSTFPAAPSDSFWTSSLFGNKSAEAWYVAFDHGQALYGLLKATHRVRCVR